MTVVRRFLLLFGQWPAVYFVFSTATAQKKPPIQAPLLPYADHKIFSSSRGRLMIGQVLELLAAVFYAAQRRCNLLMSALLRDQARGQKETVSPFEITPSLSGPPMSAQINCNTRHDTLRD